MVYALEEKSDGIGQIVEWRRLSEWDLDFERMQAIDLAD